jgi:hypothetical protein
VAGWEAGEGQQVGGGVAEHGLQLGELAAQHARDAVELVVDVGCIRLGEDGPDGRGDHLG